MKKIFIPNEKVRGCETCKYFTGMSCMVHKHIPGILVFPGDSCGLHSDLESTPIRLDELIIDELFTGSSQKKGFV